MRTPLAGQRTVIQVALADPDATKATLRSACEDALALGGQQERLIAAFLLLATSERGVDRREPFDLANVVDDVLQSQGPIGESQGITVRPALNAAPMSGDPSLVASLVTNLVENALRYNRLDGWVEISTTTRANLAVISVGNSGPVIPSDQLERLFAPFQRLDNDRLHRADGHGLGLAIVRAIADAHDATLTAQPRSGGGLDITVSFRAQSGRN